MNGGNIASGTVSAILLYYQIYALCLFQSMGRIILNPFKKYVFSQKTVHLKLTTKRHCLIV